MVTAMSSTPTTIATAIIHPASAYPQSIIRSLLVRTADVTAVRMRAVPEWPAPHGQPPLRPCPDCGPRRIAMIETKVPDARMPGCLGCRGRSAPGACSALGRRPGRLLGVHHRDRAGRALEHPLADRAENQPLEA